MTEPYNLSNVMPAPPKETHPRWAVPVVIGLAVLVLAAVGVAVWAFMGRGGEPSAGPPPALPSPTGKVATVGQYAGIISDSGGSFQETWATYSEDCYLVEPEPFACKIQLLSVNVTAQTLVLTLSGANKPGVPAFIGAPPAELAKLVKDTLDAAQAVDDAVSEDEPNEADRSAVWGAGNRLDGLLDRWAPYI
jgi:hypothetical protein